MIKPVTLDLEQQLVQAIDELARLEKQHAFEQRLVVEWEKKAMLAVKAGNDDLAKQALLRRRAHEVLEVEHERAARAHVSFIEALKKGRDAGQGASSTLPVAVPVGLAAGPTNVDPTEDLEAKLAELGDGDIEAALDALKTKMGIAPRRGGVRGASVDDLARQIVAEEDKKKRKKN